jgi:hypothetical protein
MAVADGRRRPRGTVLRALRTEFIHQLADIDQPGYFGPARTLVS